MIGYYIHHHGAGHLHRACAIAEASTQPMVGLSSRPRPRQWTGPWLQLDQDHSGTTESVTASGRLHWAPLGHDGLRARMADISAWIEAVRPSLMVVDVSVEVALLARLHGIPVVTVVQPGDRRDRVHELGYAVSDALVACWPPGVEPVRLPPTIDRGSVHEIGGLSRFAPGRRATRPPSGPSGQVHAVVLTGAGGDDLTAARLHALQQHRPQWRWTVLGSRGVWVEDPTEVLGTADLVVTHAGQNAISEIAALRIPALVLPQDRPYDEQHLLAAVLTTGGWPAVAAPVDDDWGAALDETLRADGSGWQRWCDGQAVRRFLEVCDSVALSAGAEQHG